MSRKTTLSSKPIQKTTDDDDDDSFSFTKNQSSLAAIFLNENPKPEQVNESTPQQQVIIAKSVTVLRCSYPSDTAYKQLGRFGLALINLLGNFHLVAYTNQKQYLFNFSLEQIQVNFGSDLGLIVTSKDKSNDYWFLKFHTHDDFNVFVEELKARVQINSLKNDRKIIAEEKRPNEEDTLKERMKKIGQPVMMIKSDSEQSDNTTANDNKQTTANDNKQTTANDNKQTTANDNKQTTANDNKQTTANDNKQTTASDNKQTTASDNKQTASDCQSTDDESHLNPTNVNFERFTAQTNEKFTQILSRLDQLENRMKIESTDKRDTFNVDNLPVNTVITSLHTQISTLEKNNLTLQLLLTACQEKNQQLTSERDSLRDENSKLLREIHKCIVKPSNVSNFEDT